MRLALHELPLLHPKLRDLSELPRSGALALQRAEHDSPVQAGVDHGGVEDLAEIEWHPQEIALLQVLDSNKVTEYGAEAVALVYANAKAGWVVKRRLQRGDFADWLLARDERFLALEVSGTEKGDPFTCLDREKKQLARCSLPVERLAVVVAFDRPLIVADGL